MQHNSRHNPRNFFFFLGTFFFLNFVDTDKLILKFIWKICGLSMSKTISEKEEHVIELRLHDFKIL